MYHFFILPDTQPPRAEGHRGMLTICCDDVQKNLEINGNFVEKNSKFMFVYLFIVSFRGVMVFF